jgi:hypothetical protein
MAGDGLKGEACLAELLDLPLGELPRALGLVQRRDAHEHEHREYARGDEQLDQSKGASPPGDEIALSVRVRS